MTSTYSHRRRVKLEELLAKPFAELVTLAEAQNIRIQTNISRWELTVLVLRTAFNSGAQLSVTGVLHIAPQGFGFIQSTAADLPLPSNVYVAPSQIQSAKLSDGDVVFASIRPPEQEESYFAAKDFLSA